MKLARWQKQEDWSVSPWRRANSFRDELDNLFNLALGRQANLNAENGQESQLLEGWFPAVDVYEDKDNLLVKAELAGVRKEDVEIAYQDGYLSLSGERKREEKHEDAEKYRAERWEGRFHRTISLPCRVDAEKIKAAYNEGVLTITLPKAEEAKAKQIPITVN